MVRGHADERSIPSGPVVLALPCVGDEVLVADDALVDAYPVGA
jgi:hypothetical protein